MPSLINSISDLLGQGDTLSALGGAIGADGDTTRQVAGSAAPVLLSGLADRAKQPGGSKAVMDMLDEVDRSSDTTGGNSRLGASLLDGIFGGGLAGVMNNLSGSTGLDMGAISKFMPMLAPMVMGVLSKRRQADGLDGSGVANLLIGEQAKMERDGMLSGVGGSLSGIGGGAAAAGGVVIGGVAAGAGRVLDGADKLTDGAGSVGKVGGAVTGSVGKIGDVASGSVDKVGGTALGGATKLGSAAAGGAGAVGGAVASPGGGRFGKLGWVIGAIVVVALAAWALSQCGGSDVADSVGSTAGDAVDTVEGAAEDAVDTVEETAETVVETVEEAGEEAVDFQPGVDAAVAAAGVAGITGTIDGDGVVTLTGEAESEAVRQAVADSVLGADGVTSVSNEITVAEAEEAAPAAGSTINDILDLDPITFAVNSADITAEGQAVLARAVEFMTANPTVNVEIGGHTDSDGGDASNQALSQSRADSVKAYLEANGVEGDRMTTRGYGESEPKVANDTPENKAVNRRIEFTIQ